MKCAPDTSASAPTAVAITSPMAMEEAARLRPSLEMSEKPSTRKLVPADSARQRIRSDGLAMCVSRIQVLSKAGAVSGAANGSSKRNDLVGVLVAGMTGIYAAAHCSAASDNKASKAGRTGRRIERKCK